MTKYIGRCYDIDVKLEPETRHNKNYMMKLRKSECDITMIYEIILDFSVLNGFVLISERDPKSLLKTGWNLANSRDSLKFEAV